MALHDIVAEVAYANPDATAISFDDMEMTYGAFDRIASKLAARIMSMGVRKGDIVGLLLPRSAKTLIAKLAILKAGAAYAPFDPAYPAEHLSYVLEDSAPRALMIDRESTSLAANLPIAGARLVDIDKALSESAGDDPKTAFPSIGGGDAAYVMYTSGSTGRPKGVVIPHRGIQRLVCDQNFVDFRPYDVVLHTASISFDASTFEIWGALLNGAHLTGIGDRTLSMQRIATTIESKRVSIALLTTGLFNLLVDHAGGNFGSLRQMLFGGEVASADHVRRFLQAHPSCVLTNVYGPTEVSCMASTYEVPSDFAGDTVPIGYSIANNGVHILDDDFNELSPGREGQLAVSGDGLAIGYLNRPELTEERFVTIRTATGETLRCYLTGDMAVMDPDGLLHFRGRRDRQVKIDGKRIELDEIETVLRRDNALADAVVQCHQAGPVKRLVAYLRPRSMNGLDEIEFAAGVLTRLKGLLPAHMVPGRAIVLQAFPLNRSGKVDRTRLPNPIETAPTVTASNAPPSQGIEGMIARHWRAVLGTDAVGLDQNFFDLGGTSMQLMRVHAVLEQELGRSIDVVSVFEHAKIRALARFLQKAPDGDQPGFEARNRAARQKRGMSQFRRSRQ
ncbi:amino acid adenylation domain-containing protein [Nitratireductor kimnyeongensis]|uniref:Amino acid adenylation domain-containing protein n=1 Tax=Nitratireductor kimnyeongensis TaxID=430679 RepID=A0ABW0T482_9HYPH|nr:amino acid adenylation domain-containing protein [Nitratireductor kimnyeongensis]